jgi:SAM-dependent methyltransferase
MTRDPEVPDPFQRVYAEHAALYDELVRREDAPGNLLPALEALHPLAASRVVEFGAGTGRLTRLLAPRVGQLRAFDGAPAMLEVARAALAPWPTVSLELADNARLPVATGWADLAIEGWSFGHAVGWFPDRWRQVVTGYLAEMERVLRPGGCAILLETLGTGSEIPRPPNGGLGQLYELFEARGFRRAWLRTDYRFASEAEARRLTGFFFNREFRFLPGPGGVALPECTGLWSRRTL